jgi:hypothetical protein
MRLIDLIKIAHSDKWRNTTLLGMPQRRRFCDGDQSQNLAQQATVGSQTVGIIDKARLLEPDCEIADPRWSRVDHLGQEFLINLSEDSLGPAFIAKIRKQQKNSGRAFFTGMKSRSIRSASYQILRESWRVTNNSETSCCSWSMRIITGCSILIKVQSDIMEAVAMRIGSPARQPSPKKSLALGTATIEGWSQWRDGFPRANYRPRKLMAPSRERPSRFRTQRAGVGE